MVQPLLAALPRKTSLLAEPDGSACARPIFLVSTLSELYIENRKEGTFRASYTFSKAIDNAPKGYYGTNGRGETRGTALIRTPREPYSSARERVKLVIAPFAAL
jgi:hypothetical protein